MHGGTQCAKAHAQCVFNLAQQASSTDVIHVLLFRTKGRHCLFLIHTIFIAHPPKIRRVYRWTKHKWIKANDIC